MTPRVALIGVGGFGHLVAEAYGQMEDVSLVAAADVSEDARAHFEREFDAPAYEHYRKLLHEEGADLDGVTITTPHTLHYEQAKACLERGLHVLVEKPMVTDVAHAVDLIETADERRATLHVGYQRHFDPAFREVKRILEAGRIGALHAVNCHLGQDWIDIHGSTWRSDPSLSGGGQLYDTGSHLLDTLLWTTGAEPQSVGAQIEYEEPDVDVNSALSLRLERGDDGDGETVIASVGLSGDGVDVTPSEGYFYWGTQGRLSYAGDRIAVSEKDGMTYRTDITDGADFQTLNRRKLEHFVESIRGEVDPLVPGEVGLAVTALTEAAYRAAETDSSVAVQPLVEAARDDRA